MKKISVIINCFNGEEFLHECIDSVINQTYQNWEIIFWDNLSTDSSKEIFFSFKDSRLKYFLAENHTKLFRARNLALEKVAGDFICFLDVDDYWQKTKLEKQIKFFINDPELMFAYTKYFIVDENKKIILKNYHIFDSNINKDLIFFLKNYQIGLSTIMLNSKLIDEKKFKFNDDFNIIGDFDAFINLIKKYKHCLINEYLSYYRWHKNNLSTVNNDEEIRELKIWQANSKKNKMFSRQETSYIDQKINFSEIYNLIKNNKNLRALQKIFFPPLTIKKFSLIKTIVKNIFI